MNCLLPDQHARRRHSETMIAYVVGGRCRSTDCVTMMASPGSILIILALFVGRELNCFLHFNNDNDNDEFNERRTNAIKKL